MMKDHCEGRDQEETEKFLSRGKSMSKKPDV